MKRLMMPLLGVLMLAGSAPLAQANEGHCPMCAGKMMKDPGEKADHMAVMLDLNDKQKAEVKRLLEAKQQKVKPAMDQLEQTMNAARDEFNAGVKKVLNDKQLKKFDAMQEMHQKKN